ncbi:MAG: hypothetical protein ABL957_01085 [Parvularculaceae bacterium]
MKLVQAIFAFLAAAATTYVASVFFYTHQVISLETGVGAVYTTEQGLQTLLLNLQGFGQLGAVFSIALIIGFIVAFALKRLIKPLAMIAYPLAGAAAVVAAIYLVETTMAKGGAGAIWGARDPIGLALQGLAGAFGGTVFALLRPR